MGRAAALGAAWTTALVVLLGMDLPIAAAAAGFQLAQFQLPQPARAGEAPAKQLPTRLTFEYGYGSESEIAYRRNPDLNSDVRDDAVVMTPEIGGTLTYRPADWVDTTLEMIFEREIPLQEEDSIRLPDGDVQLAENRRFSLLVDQAFVTIKDFTDPVAITLGRRNHEDDRHWLYDASMDIAGLSLKLGQFRLEALYGREAFVDLDLLKREELAIRTQQAALPDERDRIDTYILYTYYRGIEDIKLAAYTVFRDDRDRLEGRPLLMGAQSQGMPSSALSYWINLAHMRGRDERSRDLSGYAFDVGVTHRFLGLPYNPNLTLGYAFGSGDDNRSSRKSSEFRQTGLQSNETMFAGVAEFKTYGEALDPELSNLHILTAGVGVRPAPNVSLDLVYHRYRLHELAVENRNAEITALMNQVDTRLSRDLGSAFDMVLGIRSLFGVRRLGMDLRSGWLLPGKAFLRDDGTRSNPDLRDADKLFTIVAKAWW